jgi:hypothetical protein
MAAYFEDNEWCYRVSRERPASFRRSREALVFHQLARKRPPDRSFAASIRTVELLRAHARFYERHGVLMTPWLFDLLPELRDDADGTCDYPGARVLMELLLAKGTDWTAKALANGELTGLLNAHRREAELRRARPVLAWAPAEVDRLRGREAELERTIAYLATRNETLTRVEQGGWWRLRGRLLRVIGLREPLLRALGRLTGR